MNYGIRIQVLILAVQTLLPTEQSPQPKDNFLSSIMALYANVKSTSIKDLVTSLSVVKAARYCHQFKGK